MLEIDGIVRTRNHMYYINLSLAYKLVIVLSPCFCFCLSLEYRGGGQD